MILNPHASVVFCDDIRNEISGKLIFIGVYNDSIFFDGPTPWVLQTGLHCYVTYEEAFPEEIPEYRFRVQFFGKDGVTDMVDIKPQPTADAVPFMTRPFEFEEDSIRVLKMVTSIKLPPLRFEGPTKIRVIVERGGDTILGGTIRVLALPDDLKKPST